ncbi:unnamed protein product [Rotaria sp. Silwood1]|nr:unnamed protein product [Rotaria sp. Silwood1]
MHHPLVIIIEIFFASITYGRSTSKSFTESYHPGYSTVGNPNVLPEYDCALRAFTIELLAYIAPVSLKVNWTALSQSAFQTNQCNSTLKIVYQPTKPAKPFKTAREIKRGICHHTVYVHNLKGNDMFDRTFERTIKTIQATLSLTRTLRATHGSVKTLCMTIREGTYYLGTNATTTSSQIGAIALTTNGSNLVIENQQDERVILSSGTLLKLQ